MSIVLYFWCKLLTCPRIFKMTDVGRDLNLLQEYIPRRMLPVDYGGDGPSLEKIAGTRVVFVSFSTNVLEIFLLLAFALSLSLHFVFTCVFNS